jgi:hypothetical protein
MAKSKSTKDDEEVMAPEPGTTRTGVDILPADREILNQSIDDRMAALLKDHQEMGARPK